MEFNMDFCLVTPSPGLIFAINFNKEYIKQFEFSSWICKDNHTALDDKLVMDVLLFLELAIIGVMA